MSTFSEDYKRFAAAVAKAQAELDALCPPLDAETREWLSRQGAEIARAEALMEQMRGSLPKAIVPPPILSSSALRVTFGRLPQDSPAGRTIVRRVVKTRIGFVR